MGKTKMTGRAMSMPSGLAMGAAVSAVSTVAISFIGAQLILKEILDQKQIGYCSLAAILISTLLGAVTSSKKIQRRQLLVCLISGALYFCMLLSVTALFFGGRYAGVGTSFVTILLGSLSAVLLLGREGKRSNHRRRTKL